ncbi:chemotaxis-specific protein-glutamate methyltransferase CheB [Anaerocolumna sedimenticola]|uniref:Protein-glutamate methylesterase/protein-glutamine glutaminase n=1 Tax=Anaerocolumna sedimenticola TaxID=2696063 RepID=A0A6P1TR69_9FIRM|nr:chemotaxis response regulator protein-glutamate methylesterase [Anaerocolumna sedimenticola]QHQ62749.1 chemotaxis-specific protein-glutamate methyltransferase CheB [Anaerocolumna sedimenticola]
MERKIKVLVVDDSMVYREVLARGISTDPNMEVVATATDPFDARDKILEYKPDVMTCDVEMPKMSGIEFIKRLLPQYPLPVIVVSSISDSVFQAMNAGAIDFVAKPNMNSAKSVEEFINDMIFKIKIAAAAKVQFNPKLNSCDLPEDNVKVNAISGSSKIIAVGASTGGTEAIYNLIKRLPNHIPGIVIVLHIPPVFSGMFAERLNTSTAFHVKEAKTGDYIKKGHILIAPGDKHMKIKKVGENYRVDCYEGSKVNGHCPSVDILFESVAKEAGANSIGIILTGMGYDGAKGLLAMRQKGARTIGQDEKSSVVYGMPKVAFNIGAVERQASLDKISLLLYSMLSE